MMPLPGDMRFPADPGDAASSGIAFADFLRTDDSSSGRRADHSKIALPVEREVRAELPPRADPSRPSEPRHRSASEGPSQGSEMPAEEEPIAASAGEPENASSSADDGDGLAAAGDETPPEETADAEPPAQLPPGNPAPSPVVDPAFARQAKEMTAAVADAAGGLTPSVEGDEYIMSAPVAPVRPEAAPPRLVAAVTQHAAPVISFALPVGGLELLQGDAPAAAVASQAATATSEASANTQGASALAAGQAQQAAVSGALSNPAEPQLEPSVGVDAEETMAVSASGGTGEAHGGAGEAGNDAGGGDGDHLGAGLANAANASATGRGESVRAATALHSAATQLAEPVARAAKAGMQRVEIALEPAALGRVDVRLDFAADGRVSAFFVTDNRQALEALRADAQTLARALADAGVDAGSLDFGLRQGAQDTDGGSFRQDSGRKGGGQPVADPEPSNATAATHAQYSGLRGRLDIRA
jgi:flagellar hook-length control protein FliK